MDNVAMNRSPAYALQCGHVYHSFCITAWFTRRPRTCPHCRTRVPSSAKLIKLFLNFEPMKNLEKDLAKLKVENEIIKEQWNSIAHRYAHKVQDIRRLEQCNYHLRQQNSSLQEKLSTARTLEHSLHLAKSELNQKKQELNRELREKEKLTKRLTSLQHTTADLSGSSIKTRQSKPLVKIIYADDLLNVINLNVRDLGLEIAFLSNELGLAREKIHKLGKILENERSVNSILSGIAKMYYRPSEIYSSQALRVDSPSSKPDPHAVVLVSRDCPKLEKKSKKSSTDSPIQTVTVSRQLFEDSDVTRYNDSRSIPFLAAAEPDLIPESRFKSPVWYRPPTEQE
ncbi:unnamed protein product [Nesidiocoris tenuis]|uniref:RING-type domain-containing protein n=1 Tax=Nesidiocoris tenuis TaxID=355587 RepID=A0A6H5HBU6_9HEMI|nr:unnamed protein product [Nesidiocoris tenuis]